MYIDSALKKADKLDKKNSKKNKEEKTLKPVKISWSEYKEKSIEN